MPCIHYSIFFLNLWEDSDGSSAMHVLMHFRYFEACGSACIILRRSYTGMYNIHTFERASEAFFKGLATITNSIYRKHKQVLLILSIKFKENLSNWNS